MAKTKTSEIIVGLDIGTTKIACIAGEVTEDGVDIIGIGTAPSKGLRRGYVVNIDATVASIQQAVDEAENMAGCEITTVYAGDLRRARPRAQLARHRRGQGQGGPRSRHRARDRAAKAVAIPMDREVLHVLPQQYVVDDQDGIRDPLGMAGVRLEAKVHIVTTAVASAQNVIKCANRCNLQVADIVLESLASAQAVLEDDEKELGVALVDIGGGTCDLMVYADGAIVHTVGAAARRRPHHERHRDRAAHAARLGREDQAEVRLRVARPRRGRRDDGGAVGRWPRPARAARRPQRCRATRSRTSSQYSRRVEQHAHAGSRCRW